MAIFEHPQLDFEDLAVLDEIHQARIELGSQLRMPKRWSGMLRRNAVARAIRGSNSIEGYHVDLDDAIAAVEGDEPNTTDTATWLEIRGYRLALGYVLATAEDSSLEMNEATLRSLHYMMLSHDLTKSPGRYRTREIFVQDEETQQIVYVAPEPDQLPGLMNDLVLSFTSQDDAFVDAAMAHLNLVMIHPFRDGNGRMARCLQTWMLGRGGIGEPEFSSIEEWLGRNTDDYYKALAVVGQGSWNPSGDAALWVKFCLRAHHMQMQTLKGRFNLAERLGNAIVDELEGRRLPERMFDVLYDAAVGLRVLRGRHAETAQIDDRTATRDLTRLADLGFLMALGQSRGRYYRAGPELLLLRRNAQRDVQRMVDPYPGFVTRLNVLAEL